MVKITLYARQQKRHRCIEQSFGLCGRGRGWDDLGEWHWNMYIIICEMNCQSRFDAWDRVLGAGALGWPRGMGWEGGGRGFRMGNTCIPVADSYQCMAKPLQYCKVISLQLKWINLYKKGTFIQIILLIWKSSRISEDKWRKDPAPICLSFLLFGRELQYIMDRKCMYLTKLQFFILSF